MRIYPAGRAVAHIVGGVRAVNEGVRFAEFTGGDHEPLDGGAQAAGSSAERIGVGFLAIDQYVVAFELAAIVLTVALVASSGLGDTFSKRTLETRWHVRESGSSA